MKVIGKFSLSEKTWDIGDLSCLEGSLRKFLSLHFNTLLAEFVDESLRDGMVWVNTETFLVEVMFGERGEFPIITLSLEELMQEFLDPDSIGKEAATKLSRKLRNLADKIDKANKE